MKVKLSETLVFLYFIISILSNSIFVSYNDNSQLDNTSSQYWLRHGIVILVSFFSIFSLTKKDLYFILSFFIISLIYLFSRQYLLGFMTIVLSFSSIVFGDGFKRICLINKKLIFLLFFISIIPAIIDLPQLIESGFFNNKYGRDRMLLGFFHPKEAAQPFLVVFILSFISYQRYRKIIFLLAILLLFYIGSRNALLFFVFFTFLTSKSTIKSYVFFISCFFLLIYFILNFGNITNIIDNFSSERISVWADVIKYQNNSNEQFRADSFYVEIFVKLGIYGILLFILWLLQFVVLKKPFIGIFKPLSIGTSMICCLLIYAMIDSGIASTGNLVHIFSWSMYCSLSNKLID